MWRPAAFQALAVRSSCSPPEADRRALLSPVPKDSVDSPEAWRHMDSACSAPFFDSGTPVQTRYSYERP